jgi:hypothetical protein
MIAQREREHNPFLLLYYVKQVQAAEVSQWRTAVSSKCFQLYYTFPPEGGMDLVPSVDAYLHSPEDIRLESNGGMRKTEELGEKPVTLPGMRKTEELGEKPVSLPLCPP